MKVTLLTNPYSICQNTGPDSLSPQKTLYDLESGEIGQVIGLEGNPTSLQIDDFVRATDEGYICLNNHEKDDYFYPPTRLLKSVTVRVLVPGEAILLELPKVG